MKRVVEELPELSFARAAGAPFDPPPERMRWLGEEGLVQVRLWNGSPAWVVSRHREQRALLADPRISADDARPNYPFFNAGLQAASKFRTFMRMDGAEHQERRRRFTPAFSPRRMTALTPKVESITASVLDAMEASGSPSDLVAAFALPVPARVICELMGVPFADHGFFEHACAQVINVDVSAEAAFEAMSAIAGSLVSLIRSKCEEPTDDVVSDLAKEVAEGRMSVEECVADCQIVLLGGYETTAKMIALGTCLLLQHPDALVRVREGGQQAVSGAVDELVRYLSIGHGGRRRVATADIEVTGGVIRAGDAVVFVDDVANRDPQAFEEPNRLDIGRSCRHHMAFGFGPHRCLGESLGRLELEIALPALLRRFPGLRLDRPLGELPFRSNQMFYGLDAMPVAW